MKRAKLRASPSKPATASRRAASGPRKTRNTRQRETPVTWVLLDDRPGHRTQVLGLARALKFPIEEKHLVFNWLNHVPNPLLGASVLTLDKAASSPLDPPFGELVIAMGRRAAPIARWIKQQSGGKTRVILLGRKAASSAHGIDLAVSCAHFGLLPHARLKELTIPPTQVDAHTLAGHARETSDPMAEIAKPHIVWLIGGPTAQHDMPLEMMATLAGRIATAAETIKGGLAIVTSRRTPQAVIEAVKTTTPRAHLHQWRRGAKDNPFLTYLAHADYLIVTGESESMIAEAVAAQKPLTLTPLPPKPDKAKLRFAGWLKTRAAGRGVLARAARYLLSAGWIIPPRDLGRLHRLIETRGLGKIFNGDINRQTPEKYDELTALAREISKLVTRGPDA